MWTRRDCMIQHEHRTVKSKSTCGVYKWQTFWTSKFICCFHYAILHERSRVSFHESASPCIEWKFQFSSADLFAYHSSLSHRTHVHLYFLAANLPFINPPPYTLDSRLRHSKYANWKSFRMHAKYLTSVREY